MHHTYISTHTNCDVQKTEKSTEALEAMYYIRNECLRKAWDITTMTLFQYTDGTPMVHRRYPSQEANQCHRSRS